MKAARAITLLVLLAGIVGLAGCKKKQPKLPPQTQAPTVTPQEKSAPAAEQPSTTTTTGAEPNRPQPETPPPAPKETAPAPKPTTTKPRPRKPPAVVTKKTVPAEPEKSPSSTSPSEQPSRTVVPQGGTQPAAGQIVASLPHTEALHQKMNTAQLLEATESNLRSLARALTADEQAMAQHVRSYMQQSRDATREGDVERAYNLALKAHLLSDELVKR